MAKSFFEPFLTKVTLLIPDAAAGFGVPAFALYGETGFGFGGCCPFITFVVSSFLTSTCFGLATFILSLAAFRLPK